MSNQKPQPQDTKTINVDESVKGVGNLKPPKPTPSPNNSSKGK